MNKMPSVILIAAGVFLCALGHGRRQSVAGNVQAVAATVADHVTGRPHLTEAAWYFVGGGVLVLAGIAGLSRKG